jgi:hypothetical protein
MYDADGLSRITLIKAFDSVPAACWATFCAAGARYFVTVHHQKLDCRLIQNGAKWHRPYQLIIE